MVHRMWNWKGQISITYIGIYQTFEASLVTPRTISNKITQKEQLTKKLFTKKKLILTKLLKVSRDFRKSRVSTRKART